MNSHFISKPLSAEELARIGHTLNLPRLDSRAALHDRLGCAAAVLAALPAPPTEPVLILVPDEEEPPVVMPIGKELLVGRSVDGIGCLSGCKKLSRRHFRVVAEEEFYVIEDLASRNGTTVHGVAGEISRRMLRDGDFVLAGDLAFLFVRP